MPEHMKESFAPAYNVLFKKYSVDEIYNTVILKNYYKVCRITQWSDDNVIIAGLNGIAESAMLFGQWVRQVQSGVILHYAVATLAGAVFLTVWLLLCS